MKVDRSRVRRVPPVSANRSTETAKIARILREVTLLIRAGNPDRGDIWRTSTIFISQFPAAKPLFQDAVRRIVQLNPMMLSESETARQTGVELLVDFVVPEEFDEDTFIQACTKRIEAFAAYEAWTDLEVPVLHVVVNDGEFAIGDVRLVSIDPHVSTDRGLGASAFERHDGRITAVARLRSPGDSFRRLLFVEERVPQAFRLLMGACWPAFAHEGAFFPVVVGHFPSPEATPFRVVGPGTSFPIVRLQEWGRGHFVVLPDLLRRHLGDGLAGTLVTLLGQQRPTEMGRRLLAGLEWLGESAKPDLPEARLVKVGTALEALVGGDAVNDDLLTTRGITATIAERAAFLVGRSTDDRLALHREVARRYGGRSAVLHGSARTTEQQVTEFGDLVWKIARALLARLDEIGSLADLTGWVFRNRYSLRDD